MISSEGSTILLKRFLSLSLFRSGSTFSI